MSNDNDISASAPSPNSSSQLPQSPPPEVQTTRQASDSTTSDIPTPSIGTYPPIPPYTTLYPTTHPSTPNVGDTSLTSSTTPETAEVPQSRVDNDLQQYAIAHDHTDTGVAPRPPEAFPADLFSLRSSQGPPESLPAYGANEPPRYTPRIENHPDEPETLAMHFFKFGFFFPAFWVFGALMLITPLRSPNPLSPVAQLSVWPPNSAFVAWCNEHVRTEADKEAFLARMQEVEMKWAKRCLLALGMLVCFIIAIGVTIFGVLKAKDLS